MINRFLENLKPDFSNIDEVYIDLLNEYNPDNINKTEVMFIDSINFDNIINDNEINKVNASKLSEYLAKKRSKVVWFNLDYLRQYLKTKLFFEPIRLKEYNHLEFQELSIKLRVYQDRFCYIYFHLYESERMEFKSDVIDRVNDLIQKQKATKFIKLFSEFIEKIENKSILFDTIYLCKTAMDSVFFETMIDKFSEDGTINKHQWNYQIKTEFSRNSDEILNNDNLRNIYNIKFFLLYEKELVISIVKLCILCYHFDYKQLAKLTEIESKIIEIDNLIKSISQLSINIEYLIFNNEFDKALKFKELIKVQIESIIDYIKHAFFIHIETTPIYKKLNDLKLEFENQSKFDIEKIKLINLNSDNTSTNKPKIKDKTKELWFKIGLSFAEGKPQSIKYNDKKISFEKIGTDLGFKVSDKTYFSNTLQNTKNIKNIYNSFDKMKLLYDYCIEKNIDMCEDFVGKYKELELKNI